MTYEAARKGILSVLRSRGWSDNVNLKTPYATSPNGLLRLWFRPQAVHYTKIVRGGRDAGSGLPQSHNSGDARTVSYDLDIRKVDPGKLVTWIEDTFSK